MTTWSAVTADPGTRRLLDALTAHGFTRGAALDGFTVVTLTDGRKFRLVADTDRPDRIRAVLHEGHRYTAAEAAELIETD